MTQHDPSLALRQMLEHAREAVTMVRGATRTDLDSNRQLELSLTRLLEIVGEAATRVPTSCETPIPMCPGRRSSRCATG